MYHWHVGKASQTGPTYGRTRCNVVMRSQYGPGTFELVTKKGEFRLSTSQYIFIASQVVQSLLGSNQYFAKMSKSRQFF